MMGLRCFSICKIDESRLIEVIYRCSDCGGEIIISLLPGRFIRLLCPVCKEVLYCPLNVDTKDGKG